MTCIMISPSPGVFIWHRGVFKYGGWGFWGVFVSGHVLVYLGICICVWKCLCLEMFPCIWIYVDMLGYVCDVWMHLVTFWIHLDTFAMVG